MKKLIIMMALCLAACGGGGAEPAPEPEGRQLVVTMELWGCGLLGETTCDMTLGWDNPIYLYQDGDQFTVEDGAGNLIVGPFASLDEPLSFVVPDVAECVVTGGLAVQWIDDHLYYFANVDCTYFEPGVRCTWISCDGNPVCVDGYTTCALHYVGMN